jgi:WD40 repeat protein/serine/threonine protein kinase
MAADSSERFVLLNQLAEEFAQRYRRGERPSLKEYQDRHPELADDIREFFPALAQVEQVKEDRHEVRTSAEFGPLPPLQRLGDFRVVREVGRGGMGVVYEAEQVSLGRRVALKVLSQRLPDERAKRRFEREARAAAKLHHTNIVPVFGVGEHDGLPYYVMQFIQGLGLDEVLVELKRLQPVGRGTGTPSPGDGEVRVVRRDLSAADVARSLVTGQFAPAEGAGEAPPTTATIDLAPDGVAGPPAAGRSSDTFAPSSSSAVLPGAGPGKKQATYWQSVARVGVQVADALEHAHKQGILHRDVKPSNLLLDRQGTVWVTDFGLAKADDQQNLTHTGDVLGTLRYMPPEAFDGKADARGDVYALGLTLYELLALRPAFDELDRHKLIKQVTSAEPLRLERLNRAVPRDLATVVEKAIDRDPAGRYQTAGELAADLQRFLDDEPIRARRVSALERLARWASRHPGLAAALSVIALLLVGVAVAASVAAWRFERLADEARRRGDAERWGRYRSNIAAASAAFQLQNTGTARGALDDAAQEHRGWEWQYLHSQLDGASLVLPVPGGRIDWLVLGPSGRRIAVRCSDHNQVYLYDVVTGRLEAVLRGHTAPVTSVAYRPDGKQVATSGHDQTIRLWDPATGRELTLLRAEVAPANLERFPLVAYNSDGSRIASSAGWESGVLEPAVVTGAGTSRLWDATTGKEIAVLAKWQERTRPAAFSPDGERVAVGSREFVHLCDAVTGRQLAVLGPHATTVWLLAYSPDGKRIASTSLSGTDAIHLWDGESGKEVAVLRGHTANVLSVRFNPDGSRLVSGSDYPDDTARLWDAANGRLLAVLAGHKNRIVAVAFSPDGKRVATASLDQTARLWDGRTGQLLAVLGGHTHQVWHVLFSPNGERVVTASHDATLRLWDAQTGELIGVLRGHGDGFDCPPIFTPDGFRLVSGSKDGTVRIWNMSLVERNGILRRHESFIYDVAFSPDGEQVASASWDGTARLWDATTGRQTGLLKHQTGIVTSVAYSKDGRRLTTVERERGITLWDLSSQKAVRTLAAPAGNWAADTRAVLNPAGTLLAAGCFEGPVRLWDVDSGKEIGQLKGHEKGSVDVAFHPDGTRLATCGEDGTIRLWDAATLAPLAVLHGHAGTVWRLAYSADGKLLASGGGDKSIRFWDARTGEPLATTPVGSVVYGLAFSPDGKRLAAGCADNTVRLFDVASRQQVAELRGHADYVHAVAWSPDGTRLVSGSGDTTVRIWDALPPTARVRHAEKK